MQTLVKTLGKEISYQILAEEHLATAIECIASNFVSGELMTTALGITLEEFKYFAKIFLKKAVKDQLSLIAKDERSGKVVGALICEDFVTELPDGIETVSPKFLPIFEVLGSLDEAYKEKYLVKPGQLYHIFMVGVNKEYAGLSTRLTKIAEHLARKKGYIAAIGEATGPISYQIYTKRLGFREIEGINPIYYKEFYYEGQPIFRHMTECNSCRLLIKDYKNYRFEAEIC